MRLSRWMLALTAAVGVTLYRNSRRPDTAGTAPPPSTLVGGDTLHLPPQRADAVAETMWTPEAPRDGTSPG